MHIESQEGYRAGGGRSHFFFYSLWNCLENLISFSCFGNVNSTLKWGWMGRVYFASLPSQGEGISHITKGIGPVLDN